jgi:hypothetical protein
MKLPVGSAPLVLKDLLKSSLKIGRNPLAWSAVNSPEKSAKILLKHRQKSSREAGRNPHLSYLKVVVKNQQNPPKEKEETFSFKDGKNRPIG